MHDVPRIHLLGYPSHDSQRQGVDRKALPEGELEACLAAIMEQMLRYAPMGRENNFFALGGDGLEDH